MLDKTGDWCFEGGCTFMADTGMTNDDTGMEELEALYDEPCIASYD